MRCCRREITEYLRKFKSDYFRCPRCGWEYPGPLLIKGDVAPTTKCQNCGHSYLVRKN